MKFMMKQAKILCQVNSRHNKLFTGSNELRYDTEQNP